MLILLSPAKTLDCTASQLRIKTTERVFKNETKILNQRLSKLSLVEIQEIMAVSERIAKDVHRYIKDFREESKSKPAILTFKGDVYQAFDFSQYDQSDWDFLQQNVRIISGLYGLLRPLDSMPPYRLEMSTALATERGKNLYQFWGDLLASEVDRYCLRNRIPFVLNLASAEYAKAVLGSMTTPVVQVDFKIRKAGRYQIIGLLAKRARGEMTDYIVKNKVTKISELKKFARQNYQFNAKLSEDQHLIFTTG